MKRIFVVVVALLSTLCWSCKDESGDFIEQLYTDADLSSAARSCLTVAKDTAVAHLCDTGLIQSSIPYHIALPDDAQFRAIHDTLGDNAALLTTLENQINAACEQMGNEVTSTFNTAISSLTFSDPSSLVYGSSDALTSYFQTCCESSLQSSLASTLASKMQASGATTTWNQIVTIYNNSGAGPLSYDLNAFVMKNFTPSIFTEMAKEEALIRSDKSHRVTSSLQNVFAQ